MIKTLRLYPFRSHSMGHTVLSSVRSSEHRKHVPLTSAEAVAILRVR
jgi:hypothetical protein